MGIINAKDKDIYSFIERNNFYIPPYQRGYSWNEKNAEQLFDDIFDHLKNNKDGDYFLGNIITYPRTSNELVIVDGQQRITTIMLLIIAMRISLKNDPFINDKNKNSLDEKLRELVFTKESKNELKNKIKLFSSRKEIVDDIIQSDINEFNIKSNELVKYKNSNYYKNLNLFINLFKKNMKTFKDYEDFKNIFKI